MSAAILTAVCWRRSWISAGNAPRREPQGDCGSEAEYGSVPEEKSGQRPFGGRQQRVSPTLPGGPAHAGRCDEGIVAT